MEEHGPLSAVHASLLLDRLAVLIDTAHSRGLMCGPIQPENVLLLPNGEVRLLVKKSATEGTERPRRQGRHALTSTALRTISPEEVRGEPVTASTDLWMLGALLHEAMTGHPPFGGLHRNALYDQVANYDPEMLPPAAASVQVVMDRALAKWQANRFVSAQAFANAFWSALPHPEPLAITRPAENRPLCMPTGTEESAFMKLSHAAGRPIRLCGAPAYPADKRPGRRRPSSQKSPRMLQLIRHLPAFGIAADPA